MGRTDGASVSDRKVRRQRLYEQRVSAEEAARAELERLGPHAWSIEVADVRVWQPQGVAAVIADPPYLGGDHIENYGALADFALRVLPSGGALVAMASVGIMADVMEAMTRERLVYRGAIAWLFDKRSRTQFWPRKCFQAWKPLLVFHLDTFADAQWYSERIISEGTLRTAHRWEQNVDGMAALVRWFSRAGDTIATPFCGSGTEGIAALACGRRWVGCDLDPLAVSGARDRIRGADYVAPKIIR